MDNWYQKSIEEISLLLKSDLQNGLDNEEVLARRKIYGQNDLEDKGIKTWRQMLWHEITDTMIIILLLAMVISGITGDLFDTFVIGFIILVNVFMGVFQEYKTEQALQTLRLKSSIKSRTIRNGTQEEIDASQLVPGDIVLLEAGVSVPADGRIIETVGLMTEESSLTGEPETIEKTTDTIGGENIPISDQTNMSFLGTMVISGRGKMIVVNTGMKTEIGNIAKLIQNSESQTPLQKRLAEMGKFMAWCALVVCIFIYILGIINGESFQVMTMTAISLAVAIVPESLPTVVTIVLALGAKKMLKQKALIRRLSAVETLGCVSIICTDKTGTLTQKGMKVHEICSLNKEEIIPVTYSESNFDTNYMLLGMVLCNDARGSNDETKEGIGDPTEIALLEKGAEFGYNQGLLEKKYPRIMEITFDSNRKLMSTLHSYQNNYIMFTKGAFDSLEPLCTMALGDNKIIPWKKEEIKIIAKRADEMAAKGMRILAMAFKLFDEKPQNLSNKDENQLVFLGLIGIENPLRKEVISAVKTCHSAGIKISMITGDHPLTAIAIGKKLGIYTDEKDIMQGSQLTQISYDELKDKVKDISIYARVSPEHKMKIVSALQDNNEIVAMTGDGINDAPALKKADIGVAMGIVGTDVSKQASDMVLLDDNFTTIVKAVEMGRTIYDNIRKFICYMLTANFAETVMMVFALAIGLPLPLLPIHILWINLFAEGLPAFALSMEPTEKEVMKRPVRPPGESVFAKGIGIHIIWVGSLMGLISLILMTVLGNSPQWQTMVLTTFAFQQLFHVLAIRSTRESIFKIGLLSNPILLVIVIIFACMQLAIIYLEPLQQIFKTTSLELNQLLMCVLIASIIFIFVEIEKCIFRWLMINSSKVRSRGKGGIFE